MPDARGAEHQQRHARQAREHEDAKKPPVTASACGREKSCWKNCGRFDFCVLRVTSKPAASEIEERRHLAHQAVADGEPREELGGLGERHAVLGHADDQPADDVDERDDDAGDGVAADELAGAVHGAVEVGLLRDFLAAAWASRSSMMPALRSASMAICLPGMPSKAKRAATSLMRVAPLVITTNWITMMITKMISPTTILSPATKSANAVTTPPAAWRPSVPACVRMSRVVATLSTSRASVVASSTRGRC